MNLAEFHEDSGLMLEIDSDSPLQICRKWDPQFSTQCRLFCRQGYCEPVGYSCFRAFVSELNSLMMLTFDTFSIAFEMVIVVGLSGLHSCTWKIAVMN